MDFYQSPAVQLFLQNSLAKAAGLLFQAGEHLVYGEAECLLKVEIASFMLETRKSLSTLLGRESAFPPSKESGPSAPTAGSSGVNLTSPPPTKEPNMQSPAGPANPVFPHTTPRDLLGNSWFGGTPQFPPIWTAPSLDSPKTFSPEKCSCAAPKSSAFLSLTCINGKKLLVAKSDISNIIQLDEGCQIYYKGNPDTPDQVSECFTYIESELLK